MKITCPNCSSSYHLDDRKVPANRFKAKCPKCENKFIVDPSAYLVEETAPQGESRRESDAIHAENPQSENTDDNTWLPESSAPFETVAEDNQTQEEPAAPPEDILTIYPELHDVTANIYQFDSLFAVGKDGTFKNRLNDHKIKIILAVDDVLKKMLDDEKVLKVGKGSAYYPAEIPYANGIFTLLDNYFAIICTSKRILFINIDPFITKATKYIYQIPYEVISKVKRGLFLSSLIICRNRGACRNFTTVKRPISKEIYEFIDQKITETETVKYAHEVEEKICPDCLQPVHDEMEQCPHCRIEFKDAQKAMLRSLALPGWGALYLGHRGLGILEITGSLLVWSIIIALLFSSIPWNVALSILLLLIYNGTDSLLTFFLGRRGYLSEKKNR